MGKLFYGTLNAHMKAWRREQNLLQVNDEIQQQKNLILRNQSNAKFNIAKSINDIALLKTKLIDINRTQEPISQKSTDASIDAETGLIVSDQERVKEFINQQASKASIVPVPSVPNTDQSKLTEQVAELVKLMTDILNKKSEPVIQAKPIAVEPIAADAEPEEKAPAQITEVGEDSDKSQPKPPSRIGEPIDIDDTKEDRVNGIVNPFWREHIDKFTNKYIYDSLKSIKPKPNLDPLIILGYKQLFKANWPTYPTNTDPTTPNTRQYNNRFLFRDYLENANLIKFREGSSNLLVEMHNDDVVTCIKSLIVKNNNPEYKAVIKHFADIENGATFPDGKQYKITNINLDVRTFPMISWKDYKPTKDEFDENYIAET